MNLKGQVVRNDLELKTIGIEPLSIQGAGIFSQYLNTVPTKKHFVELSITIELFELVGNKDEALALLNLKVKNDINSLLKNYEGIGYKSPTAAELHNQVDCLRAKLAIAYNEFDRLESLANRAKGYVNAK